LKSAWALSAERSAAWLGGDAEAHGGRAPLVEAPCPPSRVSQDSSAAWVLQERSPYTGARI